MMRILDRLPLLFTLPYAALILLTLALGSLGFVLVVQYGFGYHPCILCLWQRVPYAAAAILALLTYGLKPYGKRNHYLLASIATVFVAGAAIALFHSGVELHWWLGTSGCAITPLHPTSPESMREQLLNTMVARCDEISWTFLGLSMANWNVPFSLALAFFTGMAAYKNR